MDSISFLGYIIIVSLVVLLYVAAWESGKKRKIGLTVTSFLALFLSPFIAALVSYFFKKIDKTVKTPTYEQRVPYENITGMTVSVVLWFVNAAVMFVVAFASRNILYLVTCVISLVWAYSLIKQRNEIKQAKRRINSRKEKLKSVS